MFNEHNFKSQDFLGIVEHDDKQIPSFSKMKNNFFVSYYLLQKEQFSTELYQLN